MGGQTDGQTDGQTGRHTDKVSGIGTNQDGQRDLLELTHIDDSMDLFDQFQSFSSREAVDNRFQRTLNMLTGILMG